MPDYAKNSHGNLAEQNRLIGSARGSASGTATDTSATAGANQRRGPDRGANEVAVENGCLVCHGITKKIIGPGFADIAAKYRGDAGAVARLLKKLRTGGIGAWGSVPMPAQGSLKDEDANLLVRWILSAQAPSN